MRLLSFNISIKIDNSEKVAEYIIEQNPDIVALQEVVRPLDVHVFPQYRSLEILLEKLSGMYPYYFFGPLWVSKAIAKGSEVTRDFGGYVEQGNLILSKFPIIAADNKHFYKNYELALDWTNFKSEDHARALQEVVIDSPQGRLRIFNIHGTWSADKLDNDRTKNEVDFVLREVGGNTEDTLVCGDFNLLPHTDSIQKLSKSLHNTVEAFGIKTTRPDFKDNLESGNTIVDYIFTGTNIAVSALHVPQVAISDHLPLVMDFTKQ